jgi:PAS domain S-box-containing protein
MIKPVTQNNNQDNEYAFELFFEISLDLLCIAGYDGYFKRINPSVSALLGYTNEELLSRPIDEFVFPDDRNVTTKARENLTNSNPLLNFENRYVTKSGDIVWLSWTSLSIDADKLIFAIAKDITHKKQLEQERNALLANLTKNNKDLKQLTYTTSHDLRSPVNNLLAIFSFLDLSKINDEETLQLIKLMQLGSEGLQQTLNNYIDSLSTKDGLNEQIELLDLQASLQIVQQGLSSLLQKAKATINSNFTALPAVSFNKAYLESIFLNLISNSIKYARPDCLPVITISSRKVFGVSQLLISDNGLGFDMEKIKDKIFGLHQKFHHHIDSKGIGLYLVYNHITSLGGHIEVESKINEGTTFIISFRD